MNERVPLYAYVLLSGGPSSVIIWIGGLYLISTPGFLEGHPLLGHMMSVVWLVPFIGVAVVISPILTIVALIIVHFEER